ncbi:hypothetical protein Plhal710r2_c009g0041121 [Plasmopara halstedii]
MNCIGYPFFSRLSVSPFTCPLYGGTACGLSGCVSAPLASKLLQYAQKSGLALRHDRRWLNLMITR